MSPEQEEQIATYVEIIPTIAEHKFRKRARRKLKLFVAQDGICCICDKAMMLRYGGYKGACATFEHIVTKSSGGGSNIDNLSLSHGTCNNRRGTENFHNFKTRVMDNNGTLPPKKLPYRDKVGFHKQARRGDPVAIEYYLAKKLNIALYLMAVEEGWVKGASIETLKISLAKPINFGYEAFDCE